MPKDNPFRGRAGARPEIYAYGLRNPYRFSFDRRTGSLTIGDVGQDAVEEIDFVPNRRGRGHAPRGGYNFGWSVFEGLSRYRDGQRPGRGPAGADAPPRRRLLLDHRRIRDPRPRRWDPASMASTCTATTASRTCACASLRTRNAPSRALSAQVPNLVSFGEDGRGRVYAVSLDGPVYRLAPRR